MPSTRPPSPVRSARRPSLLSSPAADWFLPRIPDARETALRSLHSPDIRILQTTTRAHWEMLLLLLRDPTTRSLRPPTRNRYLPRPRGVAYSPVLPSAETGGSIVWFLATSTAVRQGLSAPPADESPTLQIPRAAPP